MYDGMTIMKIKLLSLILLTLSLSLSACAKKTPKPVTVTQSSANGGDITRPPEIAVSKTEVFTRATDPNETISYEEWLKENSTPEKEAE